MALPHKKSRRIVVRDLAYRWLVTPQRDDFGSTVVIQAVPGGARLMVQREVLHSDALAVAPHHVQTWVLQARAQGWVPSKAGADFFLDVGRVDGPEAPADPPERDGLVLRVDLDPIREPWPWRHLSTVFGTFRARPGLSEAQLGTVFCALASRVLPEDALPVADAGALIRTLAEAEGEDADWRLPGGLELWADGRKLLGHGCCASLGDWTLWRDLEPGGGPVWNGHDPFSEAHWDEGGPRLLPDSHDPAAEAIAVSPERYRDWMAAVQQDLEGFLGDLGRWAARHRDANHAALVERRLREAHGLG